jgi:asparagine synthase (glutamine-hydrolysing)
MGPYLVLLAPKPTAQASQPVLDSLKQAGWRVEQARAGAWVCRKGETPPRVIAAEGGSLLIGEAFAGSEPASPETTFPVQGARRAMAQGLRDARWGRFVAILSDEEGRIGVYRDPSGALDAVIWRAGGWILVGSVLPPELATVLKPAVSINWDDVARQLAHPGEIQARLALSGVFGVVPGALVEVDETLSAIQLWRPADWTRRQTQPFGIAAAHLRAGVDTALSGYAADSRPAVVESSGGFDSSVVATGLAAYGASIDLLLNYHASNAGGDERDFARAVAAHLGLYLEVREKRLPDFSPPAIAAVQEGFRPNLAAFDEAYERDLLALAADRGVRRLYTGQGGDAVFFQLTSARVIRDRALRLGLASLLQPETGRLARWSRRSAYELVAIGLGLPTRQAVRSPDWLAATPSPSHPWLEGLNACGPGKRLQVTDLVLTQLRQGPTRLAGALDVIHPLLSQPVMEASLALPVDQLVEGGRGRALARAAFKDRLPCAVHQRRSKGELGGFYARALAAALPAIRAYLLEGHLTQQGLVHRRTLDAELDESALAQKGGFGPVLRAVAIEAWVRHWSGRARS